MQNTDCDKVVLSAHSKYIVVVRYLVSGVKLAPGAAVLESSSENGVTWSANHTRRLLHHGLEDCLYPSGQEIRPSWGTGN